MTAKTAIDVFVSPIHPRVKCTPCTRGFTRVSLHHAVTRNHLLSREGKLAPDGERIRHLLGKGGTHFFVD